MRNDLIKEQIRELNASKGIDAAYKWARDYFEMVEKICFASDYELISYTVKYINMTLENDIIHDIKRGY